MIALAGAVGCASPASSAPVSITPATMPRIATLDERYQSYNVEMAEVIGGRFWKPYESQSSAGGKAKPAPAAPKSSAAPFQSGQDLDLFEARPPVDLSNARLRKLAAGLGPAYVQVSGTWANTVYFLTGSCPRPLAHPAPISATILTRVRLGNGGMQSMLTL